MPIKNVTLKILRYKPGHIDPPRFQDFTIKINPARSVLDGLEIIRLQQDSTLMYRHSCHHSSCGTCACRINGVERLTCITKIQELEDDTIALAPLKGLKIIGDLVVDVKRFYDDLAEDWSHLRRTENVKSTALPTGVDYYSRFENCIECGACISACPVSPHKTAFLGPAVLAALNCEMKKAPQRADEIMVLAASRRGERLCERALKCSRVCPTGVYPARHISDLRRHLESNNKNKP